MSVLNQRVERDFKSVVQAQMVLADTLNQQVTGSIPVRLTRNPIRNSREITPLLSNLVNNGLPILFTKFLASRRQGISPRTLQFYKFCLKPFLNSYQLNSESDRGISQPSNSTRR